jgi:hypothetical protein
MRHEEPHNLHGIVARQEGDGEWKSDGGLCLALVKLYMLVDENTKKGMEVFSIMG